MGMPRSSLMATSRISMAAPQTATARLSVGMPRSSLMATSRLSMQAPQTATARLSMGMPRSSLMATSRISMAAPQTATARLSMGMPRGVDLNLDNFNLSATQAGAWAGTVEAPRGSESVSIDSAAFWSSLDGGKLFSKEDTRVLQAVYQPELSDRRKEGDAFMPAPTSLTYMHRLKLLVSEEVDVVQRRKELFFSTDFVADQPGPLFPSSWTSSIGLAREAPPSKAGAPALVLRPDLLAEEDMLQDVLSSAVPSFDERAEDGAHFLIYKLGSLEVRAVRGVDGELSVGAVYTLGGQATVGAPAGVFVARDSERVVKATEYVERANMDAFRFFLVLVTEEGEPRSAQKATR